MSMTNPTGTIGFDFLEFTTLDKKTLIQQFESLGLAPVATHHKLDVTIYQQNNIKFIINTAKNTLAHDMAQAHGPCVSAMGFKVQDAKAAYDYTLSQGASAYHAKPELCPYAIPAISGIGGSLIYFVEEKAHIPNYLASFHTTEKAPTSPNQSIGLDYIDHVTHNLRRGNMIKWADFYTNLFNFHEARYFDIEGRMTGLKSKAMVSPCGNIRIPLNESSDDQSQIEEFIQAFKGEGIQHIALGSSDIYRSIAHLRQQGLQFLDTPETYYELIDARLPNHGEAIDQLKKYRILIDGSTEKEKKLLLQIFTQNMLGPVFFEIIQRKGDEGFGEGNFRALFESIELDQIRRGVLTLNKEQ